METGGRRLGLLLLLQPLKPAWDCGADDVTDDITDDSCELLAVEGDAAMLTNPLKRLRRGSAQRPLPPETDVDGSKVKRPL